MLQFIAFDIIVQELIQRLLGSVVERFVHIEEVGGSNPSAVTKRELCLPATELSYTYTLRVNSSLKEISSWGFNRRRSNSEESSE